MTGILQDTSAEALRHSQQKYKSLFDNSLAAIFRFTPDGAILDCNNAFVRILACDSMAEVTQRSFAEFYSEEYPLDAFMQYLRELGAITNFELHLRRSDSVPVLALANFLLLLEGDMEIVQGTLIDITERKRIEDQVAASLREKEILLKEIHHRVKNNLQIISSLLALQSDYIDDARARMMFGESQERINSIALLYDSLNRSEDLNSIDMARYIRGLASNLSNSWDADFLVRVNLSLQLTPVMLELTPAMPCALIITELITNAAKFAFPEGRKGEIYVSISQEEAGPVKFQVGDDGVGLPPGIVPGESDSLGLVLIDTLVRQLRGTLETSSGPGTRYSIEFTPHIKGVKNE